MLGTRFLYRKDLILNFNIDVKQCSSDAHHTLTCRVDI